MHSWRRNSDRVLSPPPILVIGLLHKFAYTTEERRALDRQFKANCDLWHMGHGLLAPSPNPRVTNYAKGHEICSIKLVRYCGIGISNNIEYNTVCNGVCILHVSSTVRANWAPIQYRYRIVLCYFRLDISNTNSTFFRI